MAEQEKKKGTLIIIGGAEKNGEQEVLELVAQRAGSSKLVVATVATEEPQESFKEYRKIFSGLGVKKIEHLDVNTREEALSEDRAKVLDGARVIFFTGGDQLRITSQLGDSKVYRRIQEIFDKGGTVAGTSAGASVMSETMLISGAGEESHKVETAIGMAPGLGLIHGVVIDQHFAQRGRLGRLLAVVAQNPKNLGIGIDEDTAIVVEGKHLEVIGAGAVYVLDGAGISYSNLVEDEKKRDQPLAIFDIRLHVLSRGKHFDLETRRPDSPEEALLKDEGRETAGAAKQA